MNANFANFATKRQQRGLPVAEVVKTFVPEWLQRKFLTNSASREPIDVFVAESWRDERWILRDRPTSDEKTFALVGAEVEPEGRDQYFVGHVGEFDFSANF